MKYYINNSKNIVRDSYIWNTAGSLLLAVQSVILLMVISRVTSQADAGIFAIAYANANLFLTIGKYGMKYYQISDQKEDFSFQTYFLSRIITTGFMLIFGLIYTNYIAISNNYSFEKISITIIICILKISDAFEDLFFGRYQQKGRLDIAAKITALRSFFVTLLWSVMIIITKELIISGIITTLFAFILLIIMIRWSFPQFKDRTSSIHLKEAVKLLKNCFPLFVGSFLAIYITNVPKNSIDALLDDTLQAYYGYISMPIMVISLMNGIIFNPIISEMTSYWTEGKLQLFIKRAKKQILILCFLTFLCIIAAYFIGIPTLSAMYNTNLSTYKTELLILLAGGGLYSLSGLLSTLITIIRFQKSISMGYLFVALTAYFISDYIVSRYQLIGAAILYLFLMCILCLCFFLLLLLGIIKKRKVWERPS